MSSSPIVSPKKFQAKNFLVKEGFCFNFQLGRTGAIETSIKQDPKPKVNDVLFSSLGLANKDDSDDGNDW